LETWLIGLFNCFFTYRQSRSLIPMFVEDSKGQFQNHDYYKSWLNHVCWFDLITTRRSDLKAFNLSWIWREFIVILFEILTNHACHCVLRKSSIYGYSVTEIVPHNGDLVYDFRCSYCHYRLRSIRDLLAFPIQSPSDFHDTLRNDWSHNILEEIRQTSRSEYGLIRKSGFEFLITDHFWRRLGGGLRSLNTA